MERVRAGEELMKELEGDKDFITLYLEATTDNMRRVNELRLKLSPKSTDVFTKKRLRGLNNRGDVLIVAIAKPSFPAVHLRNRIIGMGMLLVCDNISERFGIIHTVVVDDDAEGCGVGTEVLRVLVAVGTEKGLRYIDLTSHRKRKAAIRIYGKAGFRNIRKNYFRLTLNKP